MHGPNERKQEVVGRLRGDGGRQENLQEETGFDLVRNALNKDDAAESSGQIRRT